MKNLLLFMLIFIYACEDDGVTPNYGCMNINSINYDSNANVDDGSCDITTYHFSVKPIFDQFCVSCHSGTPDQDSNGNLILSTYSDLIAGGSSGTLIDLDVPYTETLLWSRIDGGGMPPSGNLTDQNMNIIREWIQSGAVE